MATEEGTRSPFTRPWFVVAAVLIGLLIVAGVVVAIVSVVSPQPDPNPAPSGSSTSAPAPSETEEAVGDSSTCGLDLVEMSGTLDLAPDSAWDYAGTTAFPVSETFGPATTLDSGIKTCFARTPEGAVLAASAGVGYLLNAATMRPWQEYALAAGTVRDQILATPPNEGDSAPSSIRSEVTAFRLLDYDGDSALVDVGVTVTGEGSTVYMSVVMPLVWEDGDWRVNYSEADVNAQPAQLPNLAGYVHWER